MYYTYLSIYLGQEKKRNTLKIIDAILFLFQIVLIPLFFLFVFFGFVLIGFLIS